MRLMQSATTIDHRAFSWCQQRRSRNALIALSRQISRTADGYLYVLIGAIALQQQYYEFFKLGFIAYLAERSFYFVIKKSVRRNRPPDALPDFQSIIQASDKFSFPSGHTSAAFLMATLAAIYAPWTAWLLYPWACTVGWSRVMLGVHFPGDTLAGAVMGSSFALGTIIYLGAL